MATIRPISNNGRTVYRVSYGDTELDFDFLSSATLYCIIDLNVEWVEVTG